ncbi:AAA domain-containing protein, partial [Rhodofomes roseus]
QSRSSRAVFVLGPSSSGKTTLCDALARYLNLDRTRYVTEVARTVMRERGFSRKDVNTYEMQYAIMVAQLQAEEKVLARSMGTGDDASMALLSDRSAIDPIVYASTSKSPAAEDMRRRLLHNRDFQAILPLYRISLFIVLQPVKEWMRDDGVRSLEDPWNYNKELFATLEELNIPYMTIGADLKDIDSRVAF